MLFIPYEYGLQAPGDDGGNMRSTDPNDDANNATVVTPPLLFSFDTFEVEQERVLSHLLEDFYARLDGADGQRAAQREAGTIRKKEDEMGGGGKERKGAPSIGMPSLPSSSSSPLEEEADAFVYNPYRPPRGAKYKAVLTQVNIKEWSLMRAYCGAHDDDSRGGEHTDGDGDGAKETHSDVLTNASTRNAAFIHRETRAAHEAAVASAVLASQQQGGGPPPRREEEGAGEGEYDDGEEGEGGAAVEAVNEAMVEAIYAELMLLRRGQQQQEHQKGGEEECGNHAVGDDDCRGGGVGEQQNGVAIPRPPPIQIPHPPAQPAHPTTAIETPATTAPSCTSGAAGGGGGINPLHLLINSHKYGASHRLRGGGGGGLHAEGGHNHTYHQTFGEKDYINGLPLGAGGDIVAASSTRGGGGGRGSLIGGGGGGSATSSANATPMANRQQTRDVYAHAMTDAEDGGGRGFMDDTLLPFPTAMKKGGGGAAIIGGISSGFVVPPPPDVGLVVAKIGSACDNIIAARNIRYRKVAERELGPLVGAEAIPHHHHHSGGGGGGSSQSISATSSPSKGGGGGGGGDGGGSSSMAALLERKLKQQQEEALALRRSSNGGTEPTKKKRLYNRRYHNQLKRRSLSSSNNGGTAGNPAVPPTMAMLEDFDAEEDSLRAHNGTNDDADNDSSPPPTVRRGSDYLVQRYERREQQRRRASSSLEGVGVGVGGRSPPMGVDLGDAMTAKLSTATASSLAPFKNDTNSANASSPPLASRKGIQKKGPPPSQSHHHHHQQHLPHAYDESRDTKRLIAPPPPPPNPKSKATHAMGTNTSSDKQQRNTKNKKNTEPDKKKSVGFGSAEKDLSNMVFARALRTHSLATVSGLLGGKEGIAPLSGGGGGVAPSHQHQHPLASRGIVVGPIATANQQHTTLSSGHSSPAVGSSSSASGANMKTSSSLPPIVGHQTHATRGRGRGGRGGGGGGAVGSGGLGPTRATVGSAPPSTSAVSAAAMLSSGVNNGAGRSISTADGPHHSLHSPLPPLPQQQKVPSVSSTKVLPPLAGGGRGRGGGGGVGGVLRRPNYHPAAKPLSFAYEAPPPQQQ